MGEFVYLKIGRNIFLPSPISLLWIWNLRFVSKGEMSSGPCSDTGPPGVGVGSIPSFHHKVFTVYKGPENISLLSLAFKLGIQFFFFCVQVDPAACGENLALQTLLQKVRSFPGKDAFPGNMFSCAILSTSQILTSLLIIEKISGIVLLFPLLVTVKLFTHLAHHSKTDKSKISIFCYQKNYAWSNMLIFTLSRNLSGNFLFI